MPCAAPARFERQLAFETEGPAVELILADVPHQGLFPAIGPESGWGVARVDLALQVGTPVSVVLSPRPEVGHPGAVEVGHVEDAGAIAITGPSPAGHLLIVRDPSGPSSTGRRPPMSVTASIDVTMRGETCVGVDPQRVRLQDPAIRCGNGRLEADEACDDANAEEGDGCFACRIEPPTCMAGTEGPAAHRPWRCLGEPSRCERIDCSRGPAAGCRDTLEIAGALVVDGRRRAAAETPTVRIADETACPDGRTAGDPICAAERAACTPVVLAHDETDLRWPAPCPNQSTECTLARPAEDAVVAARATASHGVQWVRAFEAPVHRTLAGLGPSGLVAFAYESSIANRTTASAGGLVHRRATNLAVLGDDGRSRFERRIGGRAGHVRPRAVRGLGDGGALLVAAFPLGQPIFGLEIDRPPEVTSSEVRPRPGLRVVRFDATGDARWARDLGGDGRAHLALTDAIAWISVQRAADAELFAIDRDGALRWSRRLRGIDVIATFADAQGLRVVAEVSHGSGDTVFDSVIDGSAAVLAVAHIGSDGKTLEAHRLGPARTDRAQIHASATGEEVVVVRSTSDRPGRTRVITTAYDPKGEQRWQRQWDSIDGCGPARIDAADGLIAVAQATCPSGFAVDLLTTVGQPQWRERVPHVVVEDLRVRVGSGSGVVVTGTYGAPASIAGHSLPGAGAFAAQLAK